MKFVSSKTQHYWLAITPTFPGSQLSLEVLALRTQSCSRPEPSSPYRSSGNGLIARVALSFCKVYSLLLWSSQIMVCVSFSCIYLAAGDFLIFLKATDVRRCLNAGFMQNLLTLFWKVQKWKSVSSCFQLSFVSFLG